MKYIGVLLFVLSSNFSSAQRDLKREKELLNQVEGNCQLLYFEKFVYQLCPPKGMFADGTTRTNGSYPILVTYFPDEPKALFNQAAIYSFLVPKKETGLEYYTFVKKDMEEAKKRGELVKALTNITSNNLTIKLVQYTLPNKTEFIVAYINEPEYIVTVNFSALNKSAFSKWYPSYYYVVNSYKKK